MKTGSLRGAALALLAAVALGWPFALWPGAVAWPVAVTWWTMLAAFLEGACRQSRRERAKGSRP